MVISIIGAVIGALIATFGLYYLVKEWKDPESKKDLWHHQRYWRSDFYCHTDKAAGGTAVSDKQVIK
ncbi:MAG: hypothetical protein LUF89_00875 [Ruminococcus sp.]|nr:hypothetical protein [Ruminococcus sp.]